MAQKFTVQGVVTSDRMQETVVVAVERKVRNAVYGKIQRRTSKFVAHNEGDRAKAGDLVEIAECRPMSRRKRWTVTRVVERAAGAEAAVPTGESGGR